MPNDSNNSETLSHLQDARDSLYAAKEEAGLGSNLMIGSIVDDLEDLINRFQNIHENGSTETDE